MKFDSILFVFVAGAIVGGAVVYVLYTRIAVVAAELKAKVEAFERAFGMLKADVSGLAPHAAAEAAATATAAVPVAPATVGAPTAGASGV
jgi:hypothetical protein